MRPLTLSLQEVYDPPVSGRPGRAAFSGAAFSCAAVSGAAFSGAAFSGAAFSGGAFSGAACSGGAFNALGRGPGEG